MQSVNLDLDVVVRNYARLLTYYHIPIQRWHYVALRVVRSRLDVVDYDLPSTETLGL